MYITGFVLSFRSFILSSQVDAKNTLEWTKQRSDAKKQLPGPLFLSTELPNLYHTWCAGKPPSSDLVEIVMLDQFPWDTVFCLIQAVCTHEADRKVVFDRPQGQAHPPSQVRNLESR